jgi:hypothetical protein
VPQKQVHCLCKCVVSMAQMLVGAGRRQKARLVAAARIADAAGWSRVALAWAGGAPPPPHPPPSPLPQAGPLPFSQHSLAPQGGAGWVDKTTLLKMLSEQVASKAIEQVGSKMLSEQVRVASVSIGTLAHVLTIFFQRCGRRSMDSSNSFGRYPVHVPHLPPRTDTQVQSSKCVVHVDSVFFRFFQSRF